MPASARATYRFEDGETETESLRAVEGGMFRGRIESVNRPFTFSVAAGDDSTSIRDVAVKVVPPPALKDLTVRLFAPAYTGLRAADHGPGPDPGPRRRWAPGSRSRRWPTSRSHAPTLRLGETIARAAGRARRRGGPA